MFADFFRLRGTLSEKTKLITEITGSLIILLVWIFITEMGLVPRGILPSPFKVLASFSELHFNDGLVRNAFYSLKLNTLGLLEAVIFAFPIGFIIGLFPVFRSIFERYITVVRFLPLTAVTGLFIAWFGIDDMMKVQFLAFSIFLFLLPVVIQRIIEVEDVYVQTVSTLGASKWQTIQSVFIPAVTSRTYGDIRVLAALSWTYMVVVELVNTNAGGVGAMVYLASRQSRIDKVFAVLITVIMIGFLQDKILTFLGKYIFPYNYQEQMAKKG